MMCQLIQSTDIIVSFLIVLTDVYHFIEIDGFFSTIFCRSPDIRNMSSSQKIALIYNIDETNWTTLCYLILSTQMNKQRSWYRMQWFGVLYHILLNILGFWK